MHKTTHYFITSRVSSICWSRLYYYSVSQSHGHVFIHRTVSCCISVLKKPDSIITREILLKPAAPVI